MFRNGFKSLREIADYWEYLIRNGNTSGAERSMKSSLNFWKERHNGFNYSVHPRVGDFYWIEYGNNLDPEMSYEHIGLIIKVNNRLLHTIAITTPKPSNAFHMNAFNSSDNPLGNTLFIKLKTSDFPFLNHDSVAKVSEIISVSKKRLGRKLYHMDISNPLIQEIIKLAHKNLFDDFDYKINQLNKENSLLKLKLELANIPCEVLDKADISIDAKYNATTKKLSNNKLELKLTDSYGQSETKIINLKQNEQI